MWAEEEDQDEDDEATAEVDALLDKIAKSGIGSLTAKERERLEKALTSSGGSLKSAVFASFYPLSASLAEQARRVRASFFQKERPPAVTNLPFEGLPSMDAGFAVDVIASGLRTLLEAWESTGADVVLI